MAAVAELYPSYLKLLESGELRERVEEAWERMRACDLCPRNCRVDRLATTRGAVCRTGREAVVASFGPHHGEEDPIRGSLGSGTIFFSWCNLRCVFCQNWEISQKGIGHPVSPEEIASMMLRLQEEGCHNINLVTPSHVVAQILEAVYLAARKGLSIPIVYNSSGYDSLTALRLLEGVVDIYLPDMKYGDSRIARRYSRVRDYVERNREAVKEMHRQVGDLVLDERGIARRGLLIRHLVMPNGLAGTEAVLKFIAEELSPETYVNLMAQYRPCYLADQFPEIARPLSWKEYREAAALVAKYGLKRVEIWS